MKKLSEEQINILKCKDFIDFTASDYVRLFAHIDVLHSELKQANENTRLVLANSQTWQDTLLATQQELMQLKAQVPQKVVLPKNVAEAIETLRSTIHQDHDEHLLWTLLQAPNSIDEGELDYFIQTLVNENKLDVFDLAKAIMFGYTVEQEPTAEDKLETVWTPVVEKVLGEYIGDAAPEATREIIDKILPLTREILKAEELDQHEQG